MTPGTRLLNAARASTRNPSPRENLTERELLAAVEALSDARALYPAAHAIGDRVSVKYPDGLGRQGVVVSVLSFLDGPDQHPATAYGVWLDGESRMNAQTYDSAFVHPATSDPLASWFPMRGVVADIYAGMSLAELRMHEWSVDVGVEQNRCPACKAETKDGHRAGCLLHEAINARLAAIGYSREPDGTLTITDPPVVPPSWFPMDGRRVTEESPGEAPYKPVTDKARRESIARAVIRSKPGPEGGDCDIDYRAAALVLFNLLDDIDTLDDACRENDAAFRRLAMVRARRREDVGASFDGYTVAFIGERAYAEGENRSSITDVQKVTFDPAVHGNGVPGFGPVTHTNTLLIPNRVQITHRTDEHGVKTTETVDLRDPDDLHARFAEALGREWRGMRDGKHIRAEWLAAFERAVEIAGEVYKLGQRGRG